MEENRLKKRTRSALIGLFCALFAAATLSGCGRTRPGNSQGDESEAPETQSEPEGTARVIFETETEPETQKLITSVEYTSKDGTVKLTLPDNTWKVTQDADEMRVFSSGNDAMINVVHASTEAAMKTLTIRQTKEDLQAALVEQYNDPGAYNIESYEQSREGNVNIYRYVVKYNAAARMWAYSVTYGIVAPDQAYVITGTVTDDNKTLLKAVEESVDSFSVLKDEELKSVTDTRTGETEGKKTQPQTTPQTTTAQTASATSSGEAATLKTYAQGSTMYSNDVVNVRSGPGTDSSVVEAVELGGKVTVTGETSGWYQVNVNGTVGYIRKDFLSATQATTPSSSATPETTAPASAASSAEIASATNYGSAATMYATDGVYIRSNPGTDSQAVGSLGTGSSVTVVGETDNWYIVDTGAGRGYVSKSFLSSSAPSGSTSQNTGTGTGGTSGSGTAGNGGGSSAPASGTSTISGVVTSSTASTITVTGDDGNTYTIYTGDADITTSDGGLYSGLRVTASVDNGQTAADGTRYATSVTGQ